MRILRIYLFLYANFVATIATDYRKCYEDFSLCLITNNTVDRSSHWQNKFKLIRSSAAEWCKEQSSSLAIITNKTVQSAIEAFINDSSAKLEDLEVITNGHRFNLPNWEWINGRQSALQPSVSYNAYRYAYLVFTSDRTYSLFDSRATSKKKFVCSYVTLNSSCSDGYRRLGKVCYKIRNEAATWFEARNLCLQEERSELAIFENGIPLLTTERRDEFWIGLRKESWDWWNGQKYVDVQYSNWEDEKPSITGGNCLCLRVTTGKWTDCDCSQNYRFICIQGFSADYVSTTTTKTIFSSTLTTTQSTLAVGDSTAPFHSTSTQTMGDNVWGKTSEKSGGMEDPKNLGMLIGLGVGSALLLILIVVIAVVVFIKTQRSRGSGDVGPRHGNSSPPAMHKDSPPPTKHKDDAPNTVYAVVISNDNKPVRSPSEKTSNQTVYAELDLEPKRKITQRASVPVRHPSEKTPNEVFYEDLDLAPKGNTLGRAVPESEYANSSLVDSVYANSAQTKV